MRRRVVWVELDGLFNIAIAASPSVLVSGQNRELASSPGARSIGRTALRTRLRLAQNCGSMAATTLARHLVLHREDVVEVAVVALGPEMRAGRRSISWAVMRTRLPALRTLPSST